jgi:cytochrome c553
MGININSGGTQGRSAGALNDVSGTAPYDTWKGHTLDSTDVPPGFDPVKVGLSATWYTPANGLECINCHTQHGRIEAYRNLGPRALSPPTYVISTTNDTTKDVWIGIAPGYTPNSGSDATFNPYYDNASIQYNRNDATVGTTKTSNKLDTFCAACHGNFHGGPGDIEIGGVGTPAEEFIRHPTAQVSIGALGGGHSSLSRFVAATAKVKVYTNDHTAYTNTSPGCVSCHKSHGNQNPFGLIFLARNAATVGEEGGYAPGTSETAPNGYQLGYRNLCGQCHGQGN